MRTLLRRLEERNALDTSPDDFLSGTDADSEPSGSNDRVLRRSVLKAGAVGVAALGMGTPAAAIPAPHEPQPVAAEPDEPVGFSVEVLAGHARFPDEVSAKFRTKYEGGAGTIVSNLPRDASSVIVAKVTWAPGGTSGWHTHPGPVIVSIVEGEVEVTNERDCLARTYVAGEAFVDPGQGNVHVASNPRSSAEAVAYATFMGVPDGEAPTAWVPPVDC